jgi:hypothetical protein
VQKQIFLVLLVLITTVLSCSLPGGETPQPDLVSTERPIPTADYSLELPFEGVWTHDDGTVLILTADRFYFKFLQGQEQEVVTENLAKILDYDIEAGHLHLYMDAVLLNTRPGGFDHPQRYVVFEIDGDTLWFAFSNETYSEWYEEYELIRY